MIRLMCTYFFAVAFFLTFIALLVDLFYASQKHLRRSIIWITAALVFNVLIYFCYGLEDAMTFLTAYVVEKSLSIDNLFVFLLIFNTFQIETKQSQRILSLGLLSALIFRALFLWVGLTLVSRYKWLLIVMGLILVYSGFRMLFQKKKEEMKTATWLKKHFPSAGAPLLAFLTIETSDILFALDSLPAVLAITQDPFLVYTSNLYAIVGLRSLYFVLKHLLDRFPHIHYGISVILIFIGLKLVLEHWIHIPTAWTLLFIFACLTLSIIKVPKRPEAPPL